MGLSAKAKFVGVVEMYTFIRCTCTCAFFIEHLTAESQTLDSYSSM